MDSADVCGENRPRSSWPRLRLIITSKVRWVGMDSIPFGEGRVRMNPNYAIL